MAFYEGIDEEIYEGGDHYVPMQQFRLNQNYTPTPVTPDIIPTSTSYGIPTIYPYGGGGGGDYKGGGLFGNLDLSTEKTFSKQVWEDADANTPGSGGWVTRDIKGYLDPKSGLYKTYEGKNINHLGIEVPTIAGALLDKNFGKGPQPGDIKGTFTDGLDSGIENIKEGVEDEKDKLLEFLNIDRAKAFFKNRRENKLREEIKVDNEQAGVDAAAATAADQGGDGGAVFQDRVTTSGGDTYAAGDYRDVAGTLADPREKMDYYNQGGRVGLNYGGLASVLGREGLAPGGPAGGASAGGDYGGNVNPEQEYAGRTFEETYGGGDNQNNTTVIPKTNYIEIEPELLREDPYINLSAMDPLEIAKIQATLGYRDLLDNDDLYAEGDLTTNIGPFTTNTQFTEEGIGNTDINFGNFSTTIDPNKTIKNIGYNTSRDGINYGINYADGNTMFNIGTTFKHGGLARLL
jgi:hypothetical protein